MTLNSLHAFSQPSDVSTPPHPSHLSIPPTLPRRSEGQRVLLETLRLPPSTTSPLSRLPRAVVEREWRSRNTSIDSVRR